MGKIDNATNNKRLCQFAVGLLGARNDIDLKNFAAFAQLLAFQSGSACPRGNLNRAAVTTMPDDTELQFINALSRWAIEDESALTIQIMKVLGEVGGKQSAKAIGALLPANGTRLLKRSDELVAVRVLKRIGGGLRPLCSRSWR